MSDSQEDSLEKGRRPDPWEHLADGSTTADEEALDGFADLLLHPGWEYLTFTSLKFNWTPDFPNCYRICVENGMEYKAANKHMRFLRQAAYECWPYVVRDPHQLPFQLISRIVEYAPKSWLVHTYIKSLARRLHGPHLLPLNSCWHEVGTSLQWEIPLGGQATCIAVCLDFITAAVAIRKKVILIDLRTSENVGTLTAHNADVSALATSPCSQFLATGCLEGRVCVWNIERNCLVADFPNAHRTGIEGLAINECGTTVVSAALDQTVAIWDVTNNCHLDEPFRGDKAVMNGHAIALTKDGTYVLYADAHRRLHVWDVVNQRLMLGAGCEGMHVKSFLTRCASGSVVVVRQEDDVTSVVDASIGRRVASIGDGVEGCAFSISFQYEFLAVCDEKTVRVWRLTEGADIQLEQPKHMHFEPFPTQHIALNAEGTRLITVGMSGTMAIWNLSEERGGHLDVRYKKGGEQRLGTIVNIAMSSDCEFVVTTTPTKLTNLWAGDGQWITSFKEHISRRECIAFYKGLIAFVTTEGFLFVYDVSMDNMANLIGSAYISGCLQAYVAFAKDGMVKATTLRVWIGGKPIDKTSQWLTTWWKVGERSITKVKEQARESSDSGADSGSDGSDHEATGEAVATLKVQRRRKRSDAGSTFCTSSDEGDRGSGDEDSGDGDVGMMSENDGVDENASTKKRRRRGRAVYCRDSEIIHSESGKVLAVLPCRVRQSAWIYNATHGILVAGLESGRILRVKVML